MSFWYPQISPRRLRTLLRITVTTTLLSGLYGALHDQVSYTLSPEYFERVKFHQFRYANLGYPPRIFAAEVGFLATWWVGLIGGWFLARIGLAEMSEESPHDHPVAHALARMAAGTVFGGVVGALVGVLVVRYTGLQAWQGWQTHAGVHDLPAFVTVAFLHYGSYLGGVAGWLWAANYVRRRLPK